MFALSKLQVHSCLRSLICIFIYSRLHNFIIDQRASGNDPTEFQEGSGVRFAAPSEADPRGEALADERFVTDGPDDGEIPDLYSSDVGVSQKRNFLLGETVLRGLSRPLLSERQSRASDHRL